MWVSTHRSHALPFSHSASPQQSPFSPSVIFLATSSKAGRLPSLSLVSLSHANIVSLFFPCFLSLSRFPRLRTTQHRSRPPEAPLLTCVGQPSSKGADQSDSSSTTAQTPAVRQSVGTCDCLFSTTMERKSPTIFQGGTGY